MYSDGFLISLLSIQPDTPYCYGQYELDVVFPPNYPFAPPKLRFNTAVYHPDIAWGHGHICCCVMPEIHDEWEAALTLRRLLVDVIGLLKRPTLNECRKGEPPYELHRSNPSSFIDSARRSTMVYLKSSQKPHLLCRPSQWTSLASLLSSHVLSDYSFGDIQLHSQVIRLCCGMDIQSFDQILNNFATRIPRSSLFAFFSMLYGDTNSILSNQDLALICHVAVLSDLTGYNSTWIYSILDSALRNHPSHASSEAISAVTSSSTDLSSLLAAALKSVITELAPTLLTADRFHPGLLSILKYWRQITPLDRSNILHDIGEQATATSNNMLRGVCALIHSSVHVEPDSSSFEFVLSPSEMLSQLIQRMGATQGNFSLVFADSNAQNRTVVRVHDWILAARWPYFALMVQSGMSEMTESRELDLSTFFSIRLGTCLVNSLYCVETDVSILNFDDCQSLMGHGLELRIVDADQLPFIPFGPLWRHCQSVASQAPS